MDAAKNLARPKHIGDIDVAIIGSGLGGLASAAQLKQAGFSNIAVFEKASGLGGVWQANKYPNVACDTPIDLYSFRFYPGAKWTTNFAPGNEILAYLGDLAETYGLHDLIQYNAEVTDAAWNDAVGRWCLATADGRAFNARFVIWAGGIFSQPTVPTIPGLSAFAGETLHASDWSQAVSMDGKRVAVVGSGATAIQVVPAAAASAARLINFVRTPSYVMPRPDLFFDHETTDANKFAEQQRERRDVWFERFELIAKGRFPMNEALIAQQEAEWRRYFEAVVSDPRLRQILAPDYRFGCKRPLFSNAYYPAMIQDNVTVFGSGVAAMTPDGIVDTDGNEYKIDMVVWATGFDPAAMLGGLKITARDGQELSQVWGRAPEAYYGTLVKGFPNLFVINGPNVSGASATEFIEAQLKLVIGALVRLQESGASVVEVTAAAHDAFNRDIQARAQNSVLVRGSCNSYYRAGGTGKVITHWPGTIEAFRTEIEREAAAGLSFGGTFAGPSLTAAE